MARTSGSRRLSKRPTVLEEANVGVVLEPMEEVLLVTSSSSRLYLYTCVNYNCNDVDPRLGRAQNRAAVEREQ